MISVVTNLSSTHQTLTNVTLYWNPLITLSDELVVYQVGYSVIPNDTPCIDTNGTVVSINRVFGNTTSDSIVVTGLEPDTCYVFGVRVYSIKYGEWNTLMLKTMFKVAIPSDSTGGSNIGGIISGALILIITVSVVVTTLVVYIVLRYITYSIAMHGCYFFSQIRQKRKKTISKSDLVELNCNAPLCE